MTTPPGSLSLRALAAGCAALLLAGCPIGNDRYPKPDDLDPDWKVDRLRILGMAAEPPEVRPGETATFSALLVDPDDTVGGVVWLACPTGDGGVGFCGLDAGFDFASSTPEELAAAGFIGFEPLFAPTYTAPPDLLDGLDENEALDGTYVTVQMAALPEAVLAGGASEDFDFGQVVVGYKRLVVSSVEAPNRNPVPLQFTVDGFPLPLGTTLEVDRGQSYEITLDLQDGSDETYVYTNRDGVVETRHEEPFWTWYASGGEVTEGVTLWEFPRASWSAPPFPPEDPEDDPEGALDATVTEGTIWSVVRDRRGGMAWGALPFRVRD